MTSGFSASGLWRPDPGTGSGGRDPAVRASGRPASTRPEEFGSPAAGTSGGPTGISLRRPAFLGMVASTVVVAGVVLGGSSFFSVLPGAWFFGTAGGPLGSLPASSRTPPAVALLLLFGGLILLTRIWLGLLRVLRRRPGIRVRRVVGVLALWAIPLLIAPPLFSRDVYSYAGQGEMVSHHIDPYRYGTGVLGATPFSSLPGPLWSNSPSPYGPVFLAADGAIADVVGHHELADLMLLRLLELGGLALMIGGLPTLARSWGRDPAEVVLLGAGSPLVLTTLIGGAHNDALMVGLMTAGLAVAKRVGPVPGIALCALAAGVKAPAALAVVMIGWNWAPAGASALRRVARTVGALGIAAATLAVVSAVTDVGWGWIRNLGTANRISTGVTPLSAVAHVLSGAAELVRIPLSFAAARTGIDAIGLVCAAAVCGWLLLRSPRIGPLRSLGLMLLVIAILSPILWAWYLTWGLVLLSAVAASWLRRTVIVIAIAWTFIGTSSVEGLFKTLWHAGAATDLLLLVGLVATALLPLGVAADAAVGSGRTPRLAVGPGHGGTTTGPGNAEGEASVPVGV